MRLAPATALLAAALTLAACGSTPKQSADTPVHAAASPPTFAGTVETIDGGTLDVVEELGHGRAMVLVFWQTWCQPCAQEAPVLAEAARALEGRVTFVGIVPGNEESVSDEDVLATAERLDLPFRHVRDEDLSIVKALGVTRTPTIVAVRPNGKVAWRGHELPSDWREVLKVD